MHRTLGSFELIRELSASGSQGTVHLARCKAPGGAAGAAFGEEVALKAMRVPADDLARRLRTLEDHTATLAAIRHPGLVRHLGCFAAEGALGEPVLAVVMEALRGQTLRDRLRAAPLGLDAEEAIGMLSPVLGALAEAGERGLVHRDIKPSNVMLCEGGGAKLIDFELASREEDAAPTLDAGSLRDTSDYMAPDFLEGFRLREDFRGDQASDVFSLGVLLHETFTGRLPYADCAATAPDGEQALPGYLRRWTHPAGATPASALRIDAWRLHVAEGLPELVHRALAPLRRDRFATYEELRSAFGAVRPRVLVGAVERYRLSTALERGGVGAVYKAWRVSDHAPVAIKCLLRFDDIERFSREARTLDRFHDARIVPFLEYVDSPDPVTDSRFMVMRCLPGMPGASLRERLAAPDGRGGLSPAEVREAFARYAEGLALLHRDGVYHRDVKPSNLYLPAGAPESACLMDFGIVRTDSTQTAGHLPGTFDYMAPELALGGTRGDAAADLYALGLCFYEAATGRRAFPPLPESEAALKAFFERAQRRENPVLEGLAGRPEWRALATQLLDPDPARRPSDATAVAARFRALSITAAVAGPEEEAPTAATSFVPETRFLEKVAPTAATVRKRRNPVRIAIVGFAAFLLLLLLLLALRPTPAPESKPSAPNPVAAPPDEPEATATETEVEVTFRNRNMAVAVRLIALDANRRNEQAIHLPRGGRSIVVLPVRHVLRFRVDTESERASDYKSSELTVNTEKGHLREKCSQETTDYYTKSERYGSSLCKTKVAKWKQ